MTITSKETAHLIRDGLIETTDYEFPHDHKGPVHRVLRSLAERMANRFEVEEIDFVRHNFIDKCGFNDPMLKHW